MTMDYTIVTNDIFNDDALGNFRKGRLITIFARKIS